VVEKAIQFHEIGKSLGLHKKEINKDFQSYLGEYKSVIIFCLAVIIIAFFGIFIFSLFIIVINPFDPTYPSNALYSTVKVKDFKDKSKFKKVFFQMDNMIFRTSKWVLTLKNDH